MNEQRVSSATRPALGEAQIDRKAFKWRNGL